MYRPNTTTAQMKVEQRIFNTSGAYRRVQAPGTKGFYNAGDGHDHWHVFKLQEFSIHRITQTAQKARRWAQVPRQASAS